MSEQTVVDQDETSVRGGGEDRGRDFIRAIVQEDLRSGKHQQIVTRFPPEPNGYLHIGHAKSICLNFGVAAEFEGRCYLRFDDTNPEKERIEYIEAIQRDVRWLGFDWGQDLRHAADYFEQLYQWAEGLIRAGKAYVDSLDTEHIRQYRGTLTEPGRESPDREQTPSESLALFRRMRAGEFADGDKVLRARIDMAAANLNLRDPVLYRIKRVAHHHSGEAWCIYPMYDYTQPLSDALEGVTHSLCTLEFEDHRPLYDWVLDNVPVPSRPRQIEFARLNLNYTVMSKRRLNELVTGELVDGWDDPRMPTISGMRRRGYTPVAIRDFCERIGVTKKDAVIDMGLLESCVRDDLDRESPRAMAVLRPLKVVIENWPEGQLESLEAANHPRRPELGSRPLTFSRELWIERDDFMEDPPRKFHRLGPGREVRLRYGYIVKCEEVVKDPASGVITALRCSYDPETRSGASQAARKVKGTIHWVSAHDAVPADVRIYDRLFSVSEPGADRSKDFKTFLNPDSALTLSNCKLEPMLAEAAAGAHFQFERQGYFCVDSVDYGTERPVFNRTAALRDSWAKIERRGG
jgi:glutaminyl-tRNA synthetase